MTSVQVDKRRVKIGFKGIVNTVDESQIDYAYTNRAYNVGFDKNLLASVVGIDAAAGFYPYPSKSRHTFLNLASSKHIKNVFHYLYNNAGTPDYRLVVQLKDGTIWFTKVMSDAGWSQVQNLTISGDIEAVNYRYNGEDILLLATETDKLYYLKGDTAYSSDDAPKFASITIHSERVFGCVNGSKTRLWFSDDFDPTNWDVNGQDAGFIEFADECGNLIKVISFLGYLYVFRDYGIFRLTAFGDQDTFVLKKVFTDTGRIYKNSIVQAGDKIIFLADEGLFAFDGYDVVRIARELPVVKNKDSAVGAYLEGKYYLAAETDIDSSLVVSGATNNVVVIYDMFEKSICMIAGVDVRAMREVKTESGAMLTCVFDTGFKNKIGMISTSGKLFSNNLKKIYATPFSDMGVWGAKTVRELIIKTAYPITVTVKLDANSYDFELSASTKPQRIIVEKSGQTFGVEIVSTEQNLSIAPIVAVIDFMRQ